MSGLRTVYMGTTEFAASVLRRIAASRHRPALVVAPPDRRRGRGQHLASPPAAEAARELEIELLQTADVNGAEELERIRAAGAELGVVCAFGQIIGQTLLAELELWNVHPSLLPRWRGAAPVERAIMAGDSETGISIALVTEGLDSGPVALAESVRIEPQDDYGTLSSRLAELAGELAVTALERRASGELETREQDEDVATYAEKIDSEERALDPARPASELAATVRALTPQVGAHLELENGEWLGVRASTAVEEEIPQGRLVASAGASTGPIGALGEAEGEHSRSGGRPGAGHALLLGCAQGTLRLDIVKPAGKREMSAEQYLRGHSVPALR